MCCVFVTENHWLKADSEGKLQTLQNTTPSQRLLHVGVHQQYKFGAFRFETCLTGEATESASVPGDVVISECMILQCWLVHLLFACLSRVDANTFKPLGTPLQQPRKCIFHWILQSNMAWMPWNVHYFLLESYKAYSFTLFKAVDFAISTINILIIDVNLAHIYKNKRKKGWFVLTCGAFIEETFTVWTLSPDPQGPLALFPCGLIFVLMRHAGSFFSFLFFIHDPTWHTVLTLETCFIAYWITDFPKWCLRIVDSKYFTSAGHRREGKNAKYKELNQSLNGIYVVRSFSFPIWNLLPVLFFFPIFFNLLCKSKSFYLIQL